MVEVMSYDEVIKISDLEFDPDNPNVLTEEEKLRLNNSIKHLNLLQPIIVDQDNKICDGEHRAFSAKKNGMEEVHCVRVKTDDDLERRKIRQALNKVHGTHDPEKDLTELNLLAKYDQEFLEEVVGISEDEIKGMVDLEKYSEKDNQHFGKRSTEDDETLRKLRDDELDLDIGKEDFNMKKIVIEFTEEEYNDIEDLINSAMEHLDAKDHKELFVALLHHYND